MQRSIEIEGADHLLFYDGNSSEILSLLTDELTTSVENAPVSKKVSVIKLKSEEPIDETNE